MGLPNKNLKGVRSINNLLPKGEGKLARVEQLGELV